MLWEQPVQYASQSDVGLRRENNEDNSVVRLCREQAVYDEHGHLFVVADGMGGHAVGELASKLAVETVPLAYYKSSGTSRTEALRAAITEANRVINERGTANLDFRKMGTTCSAMVLSPEGVLVGHVGDSRVYRVRDHRIDQLTFDHSLLWELRRQGRLRPEDEHLAEPRNVITRSLGPEPRVEVDIEGPFPVIGGDRFVLCSDGLVAHVQDGEIGAAVRYLPPKEACRFLVNLALVRGGTDNVTVVVTSVGTAPGRSLAETSTRLERLGRPRTWPGYLGGTLAILLGLFLGLQGAWNVGSVLGVLGVAALVTTYVLGRRKVYDDSFRMSGGDVGGGDTVVWQPYASTSAQLTLRLLQELHSLEEELERVGREEDWPVDWEKHADAHADAKEALEERRLPRAFGSLATGLDTLVAGIAAQRKRLNRESRWGRRD